MLPSSADAAPKVNEFGIIEFIDIRDQSFEFLNDRQPKAAMPCSV